MRPKRPSNGSRNMFLNQLPDDYSRLSFSLYTCLPCSNVSSYWPTSALSGIFRSLCHIRGKLPRKGNDRWCSVWFSPKVAVPLDAIFRACGPFMMNRKNCIPTRYSPIEKRCIIITSFLCKARYTIIYQQDILTWRKSCKELSLAATWANQPCIWYQSQRRCLWVSVQRSPLYLGEWNEAD